MQRLTSASPQHAFHLWPLPPPYPPPPLRCQSRPPLFFFKKFIYCFERERKGETEKETLICCATYSSIDWSILFLKRFYLFIIRERGRELEREGEKHRCVTELSIGCLMAQPGTWPTTLACALTRNRTGDLLLCGMMPKPLSHTDWGSLVDSCMCPYWGMNLQPWHFEMMLQPTVLPGQGAPLYLRVEKPHIYTSLGICGMILALKSTLRTTNPCI